MIVFALAVPSPPERPLPPEAVESAPISGRA
jgi:hypothetical protein